MHRNIPFSQHTPAKFLQTLLQSDQQVRSEPVLQLINLAEEEEIQPEDSLSNDDEAQA